MFATKVHGFANHLVIRLSGRKAKIKAIVDGLFASTSLSDEGERIPPDRQSVTVALAFLVEYPELANSHWPTILCILEQEVFKARPSPLLKRRLAMLLAAIFSYHHQIHVIPASIRPYFRSPSVVVAIFAAFLYARHYSSRREEVAHFKSILTRSKVPVSELIEKLDSMESLACIPSLLCKDFMGNEVKGFIAETNAAVHEQWSKKQVRIASSIIGIFILLGVGVSTYLETQGSSMQRDTMHEVQER